MPKVKKASGYKSKVISKKSKIKIGVKKISKTKVTKAQKPGIKANVKKISKKVTKSKVISKKTKNVVKSKVNKIGVKKTSKSTKKNNKKVNVKVQTNKTYKTEAVKKSVGEKTSVKISPVIKFQSPEPKIKVNIKDTVCIKNSGLTLKEHQIRVVQHIRKNRGLVVCHAVGSGKTLTAVTASQCYLYDNPKGVVIIVTPVSLQQNMKKEMKAYGIDPDTDKRYQFYTIQKFANTYRSKKCTNSMLIIDEAHELRTEVPSSKKLKTQNKTSRSLVALGCSYTADKVLLLTATAVFNEPKDIVNLVAMAKGIEPPTRAEFEKILDDSKTFKKFFDCVLSFYDVPKDKNYPDFVEEYVEIEMTPKYYNEYNKVENQISHLFSDKNPWKFLTGMRQASNVLIDCIKCDWILKKVKENRKTIIYSSFLTFGVKKIQELFEDHNIKYAEVTGKMTKKKREESVDLYNKDLVKVLFITKAGGQGLDLKGTRNVIIMESVWNRATEQQIIGRAVRYKSHTHLPEKERKVNVYHLIVIKPSLGKYGRPTSDKIPSADSIIKQIMEDKDIRNMEFLERLYPLSIEQQKC